LRVRHANRISLMVCLWCQEAMRMIAVIEE
jgi:hypothetical protein